MKNPNLPSLIYTLVLNYLASKQKRTRSISLLFVVISALLIGACGADASSTSQPETASQPSIESVTIAETQTNSLPDNTTMSDAQMPDEQMPEEQMPQDTSEAEELPDCIIDPHIDFSGYPTYENLKEIMGCATADPQFDSIAINEFGNNPESARFMLWTSIDAMIYVLRPDSSWEMHPDTWSEDQPELMCNPFDSTFASPPLPRRGFGKLWCEIEALAETMGEITKEERLCQHAVLQQFEQGKLLACFEDATYHYFRIMNDQSWESTFIQ